MTDRDTRAGGLHAARLHPLQATTPSDAEDGSQAALDAALRSSWEAFTSVSPQAYRPGTPGNDSLVGTKNDDLLDGAAGADTMVGLGGNDTYQVDNIGDVVDESSGSGVDLVYTKVDYTLSAGVENISLSGSGGAVTGNELDNVIDGWADYNFMYGGAGNDTISGYGDRGFDAAHGGDGDDALILDGYRAEAYGDAGNDELRLSVGGRADGGEGNDTLFGSSAIFDCTLIGGAGKDVLYAGTGEDSYINGGEGNDTVIGTALNDAHLGGGADSDVVTAGAGNDTVYDDYFSASAADTMDGGSGIDNLSADWGDATEAIVWTNDPTQTLVVYGNTISGFESLYLELGSGNDVIVNLVGSGGSYIDGGGGNDRLVAGGTNPNWENWLIGGDGNDTLIGGTSIENHLHAQNGNDSVVGGDRADTISGEHGADVLSGKGGDDEIHVDTSVERSMDTVNGGRGHDLLELFLHDDDVLSWTNDASVTQIVAGHTVSGFERLTVLCGKGDDFIDNALYVADDIIRGDSGNDRFLAGAGDDALSGDNGNDTLDGGTGNDELDGGAGNDTVDAGDGDDELLGSDGNDRLLAGAGDDELNGGLGSDILGGGAGADKFIFGSGADVVLDFVSGVDEIRLPKQFLPVGDRNSFIDGGLTVGGPGGFGSLNELVIVTGNIAGSITADSAAAAIGSSSDAYKAGRSAIFVVDNGGDSAVYYFTSSALDATVSAAELSLVATLQGTASTAIDDYAFKT